MTEEVDMSSCRVKAAAIHEEVSERKRTERESGAQALCGGIAQLGEHLLCKQGVNGSIPFISTIGLRFEPNQNGLIAQPVRAHA